jgi:hypothetical protein
MFIQILLDWERRLPSLKRGSNARIGEFARSRCYWHYGKLHQCDSGWFQRNGGQRFREHFGRWRVRANTIWLSTRRLHS